MKKLSKLVVQISIITVFFLIGQLISDQFHLKIPGSIIGMGILFLMLRFHLIPLEWVDVGATFLSAELLLFFIPSAVGIVNYPELFGLSGVEVILVIIASTVVVLGVTGWTAEYLYKRREERA
ncbi:CidA/LrgA family protein [Bacillus xiapuensis]|uniref:CidA/LrgA family protein n=1 Tax=Bacillus xiapuensis TaxID=2014075 RepID=UPI000C234122|nr:CidA/LrgA family holin-like protein [Bacillus xiapuensis]